MAGKTIVVGISGASGAVYAQRLLQLLALDDRGATLHAGGSGGGRMALRGARPGRSSARRQRSPSSSPTPISAPPSPAAATRPTEWLLSPARWARWAPS